MYDINFFIRSIPLKKKIVSRQLSEDDIINLEKEIEQLRDRKPHIFNIETTNYCNMTCVMCPRTIYMTRKNIWIDDQMFKDLLEKINPYSKEDLERFWKNIARTWWFFR